ncbi:MAG: preprotein translocase subunit SecA, partial [Actinomycetota bacterium]|nr:preprotein translocase subunit SecA [Actinomycetota bacterium]
MGLFNKILHAGEGRRVKALHAVVPEVNAWEPEIKKLSDDQLVAKTAEFKGRIERGEDLDDLLPETFSVMREAAWRILGQRHFDVQIMGGAGLHAGWVSEMKTGEGKTLVATLPSYLNALVGRGVHLVTVNDYLVKRDAEWMGQVHRFLGLTVGTVVPDKSTPDEKRKQYDCDITYGTNNEFGFDYLRDNMVSKIEQQTQRGHRPLHVKPHYYAIVDEVDSILIDEARTPLIISGRATDAAELYYQFARVVRGLQRDRDYEVDEAKRTVVPTEEGITRVEEALGVENLYDNVNQNFVHQLQQALRGKELFKRDDDYIVTDGEVKIVDEFTGRILEGRRWSEGLHQAVEAKEGVKIKEENQTLATVTLQNYFRMYEKLGGMTGTANTEAGEFAHTYNLQVVPVPTNREMVRDDAADFIYKNEEAKYLAATDDIAERNAKGQPILVGTISVEKSEKLARELQKRGIAHEVLNAKAHEREAEIVTQAGQLNAVTVATNMAGRGVDILLGGNPEGLARRECTREGLEPGTDEFVARFDELLPRFQEECKVEGDKVRELGGLYVLGTERHESRRIDNQLRGRAGRQGDPGASRFYLSLEDELMRLFATGLMQRVMESSFPDDVPLESKMVSKAVERAQRTVEDRNFEIRKNVLKYDEVMNEQRKVIYRRRQEVLDGDDLRDEALEAIQNTIDRLVEQYCPGNHAEEWDIDGLFEAMKQYFPTAVDKTVLERMGVAELPALFFEEAERLYAEKEEQVGTETLRDIERRVMLSVLDQHWREHLYEMDYLQEGINLRAMGQRDPLAEWQREGFDMFEAMMGRIEDDFVRYVFHLQVVKEDQPATKIANVSYSAPEGPVQGSGAIRTAVAAEAAEEGLAAPVATAPRARAK